MENNPGFPVLRSVKVLKPEFQDLKKIPITSDTFSLGRGLKNSVVIPFISISRSHCIFQKVNDKEWAVQDNSTFGIQINGQTLGKGQERKLGNGDLITLEQTGEFIYTFLYEPEDFELPRKRQKMERDEILDDVKMKFRESQNSQRKYVEEKLQNAKQIHTKSVVLKHQLQTDMNRKINHLQSEFALQIENLKGEKLEVERQKLILEEERDLQLASVKQEMEQQICELMDQIQKQKTTEDELIKENNLLLKKLDKEREEFLEELNRENTSKQGMLDKLEEKLREQEEARVKEKEEFLALVKQQTDAIRLLKEQELKDLEEKKRIREQEMLEELNATKKNLENKIHQTEQEKQKAEQLLQEQMEHMKMISNQDKNKMEELMKEREEIQNKLNEAQSNAEKSLVELQIRVRDRETELATLAAERIHKQAEHSSAVISTLQQQLETVQNRLHKVESEKNTILENLCAPEQAGEGSSKEMVITQVGDLMESELQCVICAELFITATTLGCSHTFCKYCITKWKRKKRDCPICRAPISSQCRSLVLDSFIEKMVQNLSEATKIRRKEILQSRQAEESAPSVGPPCTKRRRNRGSRHSRNISHTNTAATSPALIVDLTWLPTQNSTISSPAERDIILVVEEDETSRSRDCQTLTTEATGAASAAARADTGPPAAPHCSS
ncbi:E3 ubiquitin-protein ligase RNF8-like isoform X2 [Trichoplusia ni]|uniref:E3 ubiquitin-protein ligase CHFR n=1 Tax=Trichoplusia ni TaxID=7111 RepID=A0A7E5VWP8_TRINI|nr:E3 ubiquitin-protein ligase RNF8-like isoform X2 [Trichoplusia ni]